MLKYNKSICKYFIFSFFIFFSFENILFSYEQIQIEFPDKSTNQSATTTYYFKGTNSKALIIYFPGGDGKVYRNCNLKFTDPFIKLTEKNSSEISYDFVCFNSDKTLDTPGQWDNYHTNSYILRSDKEHILRIESAINYFKSKTNLPIILFGHSNGGVSVLTTLEHFVRENKVNLISGIIISETNDRAVSKIKNLFFQSKLNLPSIFLLHEKTRCVSVNYKNQVAEYNSIIEAKKSPAVIIAIQSGGDSTGNPCYSGYHMFEGAENEVFEKVQNQLNKTKFK
jgi:hypothetical protein